MRLRPTTTNIRATTPPSQMVYAAPMQAPGKGPSQDSSGTYAFGAKGVVNPLEGHTETDLEHMREKCTSGTLRCTFNVTKGYCRKGNSCPFEHECVTTESEKQALLFLFQDKMRNGGKGKGSGKSGKPCFSMQNNNGTCIRGSTCEFNHDISIMSEAALNASSAKGNTQ